MKLCSGRFYKFLFPLRRGSRENVQNIDPAERQSRVSTPSSNVSPSRNGFTPKDQQTELVEFAQNIHMMNQEAHKNLRLNKSGIPINKIRELPQDYRRPPGFSLIPSLLGSNHYALNLIKANGKVQNGYNQHDEQSR